MDYGKVSWNALNLNIVYNYRDNYGDAAGDKDSNDKDKMLMLIHQE